MNKTAARKMLVPAKFIDCKCPHCGHLNIILSRNGEKICCINCDKELSKESLN